MSTEKKLVPAKAMTQVKPTRFIVVVSKDNKKYIGFIVANNLEKFCKENGYVIARHWKHMDREAATDDKTWLEDC